MTRTIPLNPRVKYVAQLAGVGEVSLLGTADSRFWSEELAKQNLCPTERAGRAQLLLSAIDSKFRGIRFQELCISVLAYRHVRGVRRDGLYLAQAFNSSRLFALVERMWFSTPYQHGKVQVDLPLPAAIELVKDRKTAFRAEMGADASALSRRPLASGDDGWEGPIFLPGKDSRPNARHKMFFAKIAGRTETYPYLQSCDMLTIVPSPGTPILRALVASGFCAQQWIIRESATHARSKTFAADAAPGL